MPRATTRLCTKIYFNQKSKLATQHKVINISFILGQMKISKAAEIVQKNSK